MLHCGDCLEILPTLSREVDLVLADPPYGTTRCAWDSVIPLEPLWAAISHVLRPGGAVVLFGSQPFTSQLIMSRPQWFKQSLVWCKNKATGHLNAKRRHMVKHEDVIVFCERQPTYRPQHTTGHQPANACTRTQNTTVYGRAPKQARCAGGQTSRYPTTLLEFPVVNNDGSGDGRLHPTQKPVDLLKYLIETFSNPGESVLDFAMGSGSTGQAAIETGRRFIGIEKDITYFNTAQQRLASGH